MVFKFISLLALFLSATTLYAENSSVAFEFKQFNSELTEDTANSDYLKAKLNSGLVFSYDHQAIDLSLDYTVQGDLTAQDTADSDGEL